MSDLAIIDLQDVQVTPVFKIIEVEDIHKSEQAGHLVKKTQEVVEVRIAGQRDVKVFPSLARWRREGTRSITYAERWSEQYRAFKEGDPQEARGTAIEMLKPFGITPELVSLCHAMKIYSIEALYSLEGQQLKSLGMNASRLKDAAKAFMAERQSGSAAMSEIEALKAQIAELQKTGASVPVPENPPTNQEIDQAQETANAAFPELSDDQLKDEIAKISGAKPRGNPKRATMESMLTELLEAA